MIREEDQVFAKVVARHNLLPAEAIAEGLRSLEAQDAKSLKEIFLERGLLTRAQVEELERIASRTMQGGPIPGYEIVQRIGKGAMGAVYRARELAPPGRTVALKIVRHPRERERRIVRRLLQEARLASRLDHANLVKGYDVGVAGDYTYFAMELVEGPSLGAILKQHRFGPEEAVDIVRQIASALGHAHRHGIIHRDVKPGNILLTKDGTAKLTDLGLAKGPADLTLTRSGATLGTPQYISPEQARSPREADARSDIYSLGATLYHMVTGVPPYQGDTLASLISQVLFEPFVPPSKLNPGLTPSLCRLIEKMMAKDPDRRYPDVDALIRDIDAVRAGRTISALPEPDGAGAAPSEGARRGWLAPAIVGGLTFAAAVTILILLPRGGEGGAPDSAPPIEGPTDASRALAEIEERFPIASIPPDRLLDAIDRYRWIPIAYPDTAAAEEARSREEALERRLREIVRMTASEGEGAAKAVLLAGRPREAVEAYRGSFRDRFRDRLGRPPSDVIGETGRIVEEERDGREREIARAASEAIREEWIREIGAALPGEERDADFVEGRARLDAVEAGWEADRARLAPEDARRIEAALGEATGRLRGMWRAAVLRGLAEVEALAGQQRFATAAARLESMEKASAAWGWLGIEDRAGQVAAGLASARSAATAAFGDRVETFFDRFRRDVASRDFAEGAAEAAACLAALDPAAGENPELAPLRRRVEVLSRVPARIESLFDAVRESVERDRGKRVRLAFVEDRNEKVVLGVEGGAIEFRYAGAADGAVKTGRLHDLARDEVVERIAPRLDGDPVWLGLAWLLVAEAWREDPAAGAGDARLDEAVAAFERGEERLPPDSAEAVVFRNLVAESREEIALARSERASLASRELEAADGFFERGDWESALARYRAIAESPLRSALRASDRERASERIAQCERKIEMDAIRASFRGQVTVLDETRRRIRLVYEFDDPEELEDWEYNQRMWKVEDGALVQSEALGALLSEEIGIRHRAQFDVFSDLEAEIVLHTGADVPPFFLLFSFFGNHFGVLSKDDVRQMNLYRGEIGDYEKAFHLPGRRFAKPEGLDENGPRLMADRDYTFQFEIRDQAREFHFLLDGVPKYVRKGIDNPGKRGAFEIRTWYPHRFDRIVIEGRLKP